VLEHAKIVVDTRAAISPAQRAGAKPGDRAMTHADYGGADSSRHVTRRLLDRGESVVALDDCQRAAARTFRPTRNPRFRLVVGDVRDRRLVDELVQDCDVVIHLAARIGLKLVIESRSRP